MKAVILAEAGVADSEFTHSIPKPLVQLMESQ